jgi:hypothetical protein
MKKVVAGRVMILPFYPTLLKSISSSLRAALTAELIKNVADMEFHRPNANVQSSGNLFVGFSRCQLFEHFSFSRG